MQHLKTASLRTLLGIFLLGFAGQAPAEMFKWVDENGVTHYGDKIPPQYAKQQREILNKQGQTVKVLQHEMTDAERAEQERQLAKEREKEEQAKRDRILLDMYQNEAELQKARDSQLASLDGNIKITEISIQGTEKDLKTRQQRADQLKQQGKEVPPDLQRQVQQLSQRLESDKKALAQRQQERQALATRFEKDIQRYRQLRGLSSPSASAASPAN